MLELKDLLEGEIYVTVERNPGYIFTKKGNCQAVCPFISSNREVTYNNYNNYTGDLVINFGKYRQATIEEKDWLNTCIRENKFIPKEDIIPTEIIFPIFN